MFRFLVVCLFFRLLVVVWLEFKNSFCEGEVEIGGGKI